MVLAIAGIVATGSAVGEDYWAAIPGRRPTASRSPRRRPDNLVGPNGLDAGAGLGRGAGRPTISLNRTRCGADNSQ
jgi:hypothetical protein